MQGFGQPPPRGPLGDPLNEDPLDRLNEPLGPFTDQFDRMLNPLEKNIMGDGGDAKANIDNPSSMPPVPEADHDKALYHEQLRNALQKPPPIMEEPDELARKLDRLEESIENLPPEAGYIEPEIDMPQQDKPGTPGKGTDEMPSLPYYLEDPQQATPFHSPPYRQGGRIGRRGGRSFSSHEPAQGDKLYCPVEQRYVLFPVFCQDQNCKYYDSDQEDEGRCTYYEENP